MLGDCAVQPPTTARLLASSSRVGQAIAAATRRLNEEMGISAVLSPAFTFIYKAGLDGGLTEHELDHVFTGVTDQLPIPNEAEVQAWKYMGMDELMADIAGRPECYTEWFKICMQQYSDKLTPSK